MRSSFYDPIIFLLRPKMSSSSNGHIQVNFYPILMAIIAFCAKSVNNPKTLLLSLGRCMEGREEKKGSLRTKRGKNISTYDFALFLVCRVANVLSLFVKQLLLIGFHTLFSAG